MPVTMEGIERLRDSLLSPVLEGEVGPTAQAIKLRALYEAVGMALGDDRLRDAVVSETERYGTERTWNGATIRLRETGVKYDYSRCGDPEHAALMERKRELDHDIRRREEFLRHVPDGMETLDPDTGELVTLYRPTRTGRDSFAISFKRS